MNEITFPNKDGLVFISGKNPKEMSNIGWNRSLSSFWGYSEGYKESSDILIDTALDSGDNKTLDTLIFPIVFNYRHYLELTMKYIIIIGEEIVTDGYKGLGGHDLLSLWNRCKLIIEEYNGAVDESDRTVDYVESYIKDFSSIDPKSTNFRYPVDKNKELVHTESLTVDLINLKERMNELYNFFSSCETMIESLNENINDMQMSFGYYQDFY